MAKPNVTPSLGGSVEERVAALFALANWQSEGDSSMSLVCHLISYEARRLLHLLKENTLIVREPFMVFTDELCEMLATDVSEVDLGTMEATRTLFATYRRDSGNFVSCLESTVTGTVNSSKLVYVRETPDAFLIVSTMVKPFLVHYDLSTSLAETKSYVLDRYVELSSSIGPNQLCLVEKEFGPAGPYGLRKELTSKEQANVVVYSQEQGRIREGVLDPELPAIVLYDLVASGAGLNHVMAAIRDDLEKKGRKGPEVHAQVLYAYHDSPDLGDWVEILHSSTREEEEGILHAAPVRLCEYETPFGRRQLHQIDPLSVLGRGFAYDLEFARSEAVATKYAGRWVAVRDQQILASAPSKEAVVAAVRDERLPFVVEYVEGFTREY